MDDSVKTHSTEGVAAPSYLLVRKARPHWRKMTERALMTLGIGLLAFWVAARIEGAVISRLAVLSFKTSREWSPLSLKSNRVPDSFSVDFTLWSQPRINSYRQTLLGHFEPPLALLRVRRIALEAPVLDGTDDLTLNRGVGWISGTARPGKPGNVGIAGHRDGFFRSLKDLKIGDTMDLVTQDQSKTFVVDNLRVVSPKDVSVLKPTATPSLTLVTCYPFYFVGSAPQRYIIHASILRSRPPSERAAELNISE
jgi:sortase A